MSFLDKSAAAGYRALMGQYHQQLAQQANQSFNNAYNQYAGSSLQAQSQQQLYNNALAQAQLYRNQPKWVLNGVEYDLQGFALALFPDDEQAQLMFILKHGGV